MSAFLQNKTVTLIKDLYLAAGDGISYIKNGGAHHGIKLGPSQNQAAVQFPIPANKATGKIEEILPNQWVIVRLIWSDHVATLYNTQQVNLMVKIDAINFFFKVE